MLDSYRARLADASAYRRGDRLPPAFAQTALLLSLFVVAYLLVAVVAVPSGSDRDFHFYEERGAVTALSAIFMAVACAFAAAAAHLCRGSSIRGFWAWLLMTAGLGFLALDELLEFHEYVGWLLDERDPLPSISGSFRTWNDIIVIAYGLLALPIGLWMLPVLLRYRGLIPALGVAFACYFVHTLIDSTQEPPTTLSIILEESAKLLCSASLALTLFLGLCGVVREHVSTGVRQKHRLIEPL